MKTVNKIKKRTKHQSQLVMARVHERSIHRTVMAVHQTLINLWFGSKLPKDLEEMAITTVFERLDKSTAADKLDLLALLEPLVIAYRDNGTYKKEAGDSNV